MSGFQLAGRRWWLRRFLAGRPHKGVHLPAAWSARLRASPDVFRGATSVPVLNVSSRVFWLELDDKALLDSYGVLQEGILCDVFRRSVLLRGRALEVKGLQLVAQLYIGRRRTFGLPLQPGVLSQTKSQHRYSAKERRRLQAQHLWMEVKLRWGVLVDRMYVKAPTGKSKEELDALLFDKAARRNRTDPYEEIFFLDAAWLNEGRCPGGRPSVSEHK